jgi:hypothetical protein
MFQEAPAVLQRDCSKKGVTRGTSCAESKQPRSIVQPESVTSPGGIDGLDIFVGSLNSAHKLAVGLPCFPGSLKEASGNVSGFLDALGM